MRRVTELDAIRGLAALVIVLYHMRPGIFFVGWSRVDLFLVLSGYLVTSIILKNGSSSGFVWTFFARRVIRIWPAYFLALLVVVVVNPFLSTSLPMDGLPYYLTFTQNVPDYWGAVVPPFSSYFFHSWTLALEEQFYLFWPALVCLVGRRRLVPLGVALAAVAVLARARGLSAWLLLSRCDGLALGGVLAVLLSDRERVRRHLGRYRLGFGLIALGALGALAWSMAVAGGRDDAGPMSLGPALMVLASSVLYFGVIGLVVCCTGHPALGFLRRRWLAYLGTISYGIYLYHPITIAAVSRVGRALGVGQPVWLDAVKIAASIAVAALSWEFLERRLLVLRDRFPYRPAQSVSLGPKAARTVASGQWSVASRS